MDRINGAGWGKALARTLTMHMRHEPRHEELSLRFGRQKSGILKINADGTAKLIGGRRTSKTADDIHVTFQGVQKRADGSYIAQQGSGVFQGRRATTQPNQEGHALIVRPSQKGMYTIDAWFREPFGAPLGALHTRGKPTEGPPKAGQYDVKGRISGFSQQARPSAPDGDFDGKLAVKANGMATLIDEVSNTNFTYQGVKENARGGLTYIRGEGVVRGRAVEIEPREDGRGHLLVGRRGRFGGRFVVEQQGVSSHIGAIEAKTRRHDASEEPLALRRPRQGERVVPEKPLEEKPQANAVYEKVDKFWYDPDTRKILTGEYKDYNYICGDQRDNHLEGTQGNDFIAGFDGNDVINGKGGHDVIIGGNGDDTIYAGAGNDLVYGNDGIRGWGAMEGQGSNTIFGGAGHDTIHAGWFGNSIAHGQAGHDKLTGSPSAVLDGGAGYDRVNGTPDYYRPVHLWQPYQMMPGQPYLFNLTHYFSNQYRSVHLIPHIEKNENSEDDNDGQLRRKERFDRKS